jgi:hypothetical protein
MDTTSAAAPWNGPPQAGTDGSVRSVRYELDFALVIGGKLLLGKRAWPTSAS